MDQTFRTAFLAALNSPKRDFALLNAMLDEANTTRQGMFEPHKEDSVCEPINTDTIDWDSHYFALQSMSLQHNFSLERATHLIALCQWLTEHKHAGFALAENRHNDNGNISMYNEESTHFTPHQNLIAALESGSINRIRSALVVELENNRLDAQAVRQAVKWVDARTSGLFEPYEENSLALGFEQDKNKWDTDYYFLQSAYLNMNFSRERFEHLMAIYQVLRDRAVAGFTYQPKMSQPQSQPRPDARPTTEPRPYRPAPAAPERRSGSSPLNVAMLAGGAVAALALLILALL